MLCQRLLIIASDPNIAMMSFQTTPFCILLAIDGCPHETVVSFRPNCEGFAMFFCQVVGCNTLRSEALLGVRIPRQ